MIEKEEGSHWLPHSWPRLH